MFTWPAAILLALALLAILRRNPGLFFHPQFFGEDLLVFFNENRLFGIGAFVEPYAGYFQLSSRLIGFIGGFVAPDHAPAVYAAMFVAVILAVCLTIYTSPAFTGWGKVLAALTVVASPTGSEVFMGMAYALWIIAPAAALALYERPRTAGRSAVLLFFFALNGLSSSFGVIAAPFVVVKLVTERSRHALALAIATVIAALVQLPGLMGRAAGTGIGGSALERLLTSKSVLYTWLTGAGYPGFLVPELLTLIMLSLTGWYLWRNRDVCIRATFYFAGSGMALLFAGCLTLEPVMHWNAFTHGARYFYPAAVFLMLAVIAIEQATPRWRSTLPIVAAIMFLNIAFRGGPPDYLRETDWPATAACLRTSTDCRSILNPPMLGATRVPSDAELKTMDPAERLRFRETERLPAPAR